MIFALAVEKRNVDRCKRDARPTPSQLKQAHRFPLVDHHAGALIVHSGKSTTAVIVP